MKWKAKQARLCVAMIVTCWLPQAEAAGKGIPGLDWKHPRISLVISKMAWAFQTENFYFNPVCFKLKYASLVLLGEAKKAKVDEALEPPLEEEMESLAG